MTTVNKEQVYAETLEALWQHWAHERAWAMAFVKRQLDRILTKGQADISVLSVGCGLGDADEQIIRSILEITGQDSLNYAVVEPNSISRRRMAARLEAPEFQGVRLEAHADRIEEFKPDKKFDIILYIHALYEMPGHERDLVLEAIQLLEDRGCLIINMALGKNGMYTLENRFREAQHMAFGEGGFSGIPYKTPKFSGAKLREILEALRIGYSGEIFSPLYVDVTKCFDPDSAVGRKLLNFLYLTNFATLPPEVNQQALIILEEETIKQAERRLLPHDSMAVAIFKETVPSETLG